MRYKIFKVIEPGTDEGRVSQIYDLLMLFFIILSLVPLAMKETAPLFLITDKICVTVFIIDYILRWITADYRYENLKKAVAFARYPFGIMAIIDLLSILPSLTVLSSSFKVLRVLRMFKSFRVFRVFKAFRYSKNIKIIINVVKRSKKPLITVGAFVVLYVAISALLIFNVEPETFNSYFDALYWAVVSLTTVGYGDIYPTTVVGRVITMMSSVLGVAIIALPSGIITAEYMKEVANKEETKNEE